MARFGTFAGILIIVALSVLPGTVARAAAGDINTVAGSGAGDGEPAVNASPAGPSRVAVDAAGNIFIADPGHFGFYDKASSRVRKVAAARGIITTVAGIGDGVVNINDITAVVSNFGLISPQPWN